jgi:DNA-binding winged helix-turn-helix (wHTH) protein/tetratricopeptide (TPR) repeat protein/TolB-like protein
MSVLEKPVYRFRDFELEPDERRLSAAGKSVPLTPKVFDTLVLLVERAGHVVSKDELMKLVWPRGYVEESNLTKHIWLIRRALGDGEHDSRFIETVPKLGYRFVAPVTRGGGLAERADVVRLAPLPPVAVSLTPTLASAPSPARSTEADTPRAAADIATWLRGHPLLLALGVVAAVLTFAVAWRLATRPAAAPLANRPGRAVAFVGFSNLSRNAKDAWLAPALTEMLGAELNVAADLYVVPDELVRDASTDLAPPAAGGYAPQTLARLRQRLDADYVVSGSFLVTGAADNAPLRVDIALQNARDGSLMASVSEQSNGLSGLTALVTKTGARLRQKLGITPPGEKALGLVANEQPPSVDVARRMGFALDALRHYDPARARDELIQAVAETPGYAPAYTYLAEAWSALGYRDKALAAAAQAARDAVNLPPEQRLQTEAAVESERSNWGKAADAWQALANLKPLNPDYRLHQIDAQIAASAAPQAQLTLADLRRLPDVAGDPRIELAAARIARALDDAKGDGEHAAKALHQAQQHDAAGLVADAQLERAAASTHLGRLDEARADLAAAIDGYRSIQNPRGEAEARRALAAVLADLNRAQEAREEYQRALAVDQGVGDVAGVARIYRDLSSMLWVSGDRDGAQAAARRSLELARETGDVHLQAWTLRALATIAADESLSDDVMQEFREATALTQRSSDPGGHAWSLATYADVERLRGELNEARDTCDESNAEAAALSDPQFAVYSGFTCALVSVDRGETSAATTALQAVMRQAASTGGTRATYLNNALMTLAQLDMDAEHWPAARDKLREASRGFATAEIQTGEADAQALLALCAQAMRNTAERDTAVGRARKLRQAITSRQEVYVVDIALAQISATSGTDKTAIEKLLALAADAERRQFISWALEAKFAAWRLLHAQGRGTADAVRGEIEKSARERGFGRILKLLGPHPRASSLRDTSPGE